MAGPVACPASRRPPYSGRRPDRLRLATVALLIGIGLTGGGCAHSMGSIFPWQKDDSKAFAKNDDITGSISATSARDKSAVLPPEADLAYTRAAVSEVLSSGGKTTSAPWANPGSGARGTVTPIASAYTQDGATCHDFLASYLRGGSEAWLQGEACRGQRGDWEVKSLRPWKRS